jgi:hypothetical protein
MLNPPSALVTAGHTLSYDYNIWYLATSSILTPLQWVT